MEKPSVTSNLKNKMKETVNRILDVKQYNKNIRKRDPELDARWGTNCPLLCQGDWSATSKADD